jgi:hypothetical protein
MRAKRIDEVRRGGLPLGRIGVGSEMIYSGYFAMVRLYPDMDELAEPLEGFVGLLRQTGDGWRSVLKGGQVDRRVRLGAMAESRMEDITGIPIDEMMCVDVLGLPDVEFPYHRVESTDTMSRVGLLIDWLGERDEEPTVYGLDDTPVAMTDDGEALTWQLTWWDWARIGYLSLGDDEWAFLVYDRPPIR